MAKPRVFVSSTFYDLRHVRNDIERFIEGLGYKPVMHERGHVPYGNQERLEEYCYREIQSIDILVSIIGGKYGSESQNRPYSISQHELKTAHALGKQIHLFVEANVHSEYRTYVKNKHLSDFQCSYVDDRKIYDFIEEIEKYPANNAMVSFDSSRSIIDFLKEQWAGLFQRFLQEQNRAKEVQVIQELQETAQTLDKLVTYLASQNQNAGEVIHDILLSSHPAFDRLRRLTRVQYRIFFANKSELDAWLTARSYTEHFLFSPEDGYYIYTTKPNSSGQFWQLKVSEKLFSENGRLRAMTPEEFSEDLIALESAQKPSDDDDVPF